MRFKITPYDSTGYGLSDSTDTFHLDNNRIPSVDLSSITGEQRLNINIPYLLSDSENDTLGLLCDYYDHSTEEWKSASVSSDTSALTNYSGQLTWNSISDLPTAYGEHLFRITPYDNDPGEDDSVLVFIDQLGLPVAVSISQYLIEQSGDVTVDFSLSDDENDTVDIMLEYSVDSGNNWLTATVTGLITDLLPAQYNGTITWSSLADLPGVDKTTLKLKLTPSDGNTGLPIETADFHLDNNLPPSITITALPETLSVISDIGFSLIDDENDTLILSGQYSIDNSQSWNDATLTGQMANITQSGYDGVLNWSIIEDVGFQRLSDVQFALMPFDLDQGLSDTAKGITLLNYPGDYTGDLEISTDDLVLFAAAWNAEPQNVIYEIGPATGTVPDLVPQTDGVLDFEDLAVFIQMWNWSFEHTGFTNHRMLARSNSDIPTILTFNITEPEDKWSSNGITSIVLWSDNDDLLQVEWIFEYSGSGVSINVNKGNYFDARYQASPFLTQVNTDSNMSLFCLTGLGKVGDKANGDIIANIDISNRSTSVMPVKMFYRVWDNTGDIVESSQLVLDIESFLPAEFSLQQNYPNPFNPNTTIRYTLPKQTKVCLAIYNIRGELVYTLVSKTVEAGYHQLVWKGDNNSGKTVSTGMYYYRISTPDFTDTKKMILLK